MEVTCSCSTATCLGNQLMTATLVFPIFTCILRMCMWNLHPKSIWGARRKLPELSAYFSWCVSPTSFALFVGQVGSSQLYCRCLKLSFSYCDLNRKKKMMPVCLSGDKLNIDWNMGEEWVFIFLAVLASSIIQNRASKTSEAEVCEPQCGSHTKKSHCCCIPASVWGITFLIMYDF